MEIKSSLINSKELNNEGKTILLVSHDVNVVKSADRVVEL